MSAKGSDTLYQIMTIVSTAQFNVAVKMGAGHDDHLVWLSMKDAHERLSDILGDLRAEYDSALDRELDVPSDRVRSQMRESKYR